MTPHMPAVDEGRDFAACLAQARQVSAGAVVVPNWEFGRRCVAIVTPGRLIVPVPCPAADAVTPAMLAAIRKIVPAEPKLTVSAVAFTAVPGRGPLSPAQAGAFIPFVGYLLGLAFDGHTVVAFEGHPSALEAGCRGADLLIVDRTMTEHLQADWVAVAGRALRAPRIQVFDRQGTITELTPGRPPSP